MNHSPKVGETWTDGAGRPVECVREQDGLLIMRQEDGSEYSCGRFWFGRRIKPSRQYEEVEEYERRLLSRHEFERFQNGELFFECCLNRMKPQKIKIAGFENTMEEWWVEFLEWPE
jgi:hypothetical protein